MDFQAYYKWFLEISPIWQALLATLFTWGLTAAGAAVVIVSRNPSRKLLNGMLGAAAGVMIAASFWSLLAPSITLSEGGTLPRWLPPLIGFLSGGLFIFLIDKTLPHLHEGMSHPEGLPTSLRRSTLLVLAITLHNIPEGLAVGVAFGAASHELGGATIGGAIALALGIGLQNFPEGTAVSVPLRREGLSVRKSFFIGQSSGIVEPIAGVCGAALVMVAQPILPYALAFAVGAMIYVVVEELIPESQRSHEDNDAATVGAMLGFAVMMTLDVALG